MRRPELPLAAEILNAVRPRVEIPMQDNTGLPAFVRGNRGQEEAVAGRGARLWPGGETGWF